MFWFQKHRRHLAGEHEFLFFFPTRSPAEKSERSGVILRKPRIRPAPLDLHDPI